MVNGLSPLDPVFWLHHCNVDRIWGEWQEAGNITPQNSNVYNNNFVNEQGINQNVVAKDALDYLSLGFTYDTINTSIAKLLTVSDLPDKSVTVGFEGIAEKFVSLGNLENTESSMVNLESAFNVKTSNLANELFSSPRVFKATTLLGEPRNAIEQGRIVAIFKDVSYPRISNIVVNVFVECPYLSPGLPSTDDHYAGSFAFFGQLMKGMKSGEFTVDITSACRKLAEQGRLKQDELKVQLMPEPTVEDNPENSLFTVGSIEIVSI